jgi:hypothetical protein
MKLSANLKEPRLEVSCPLLLEVHQPYLNTIVGLKKSIQDDQIMKDERRVSYYCTII